MGRIFQQIGCVGSPGSAVGALNCGCQGAGVCGPCHSSSSSSCQEDGYAYYPCCTCKCQTRYTPPGYYRGNLFWGLTTMVGGVPKLVEIGMASTYFNIGCLPDFLHCEGIRCLGEAPGYWGWARLTFDPDGNECFYTNRPHAGVGVAVNEWWSQTPCCGVQALGSVDILVNDWCNEESTDYTSYVYDGRKGCLAGEAGGDCGVIPDGPYAVEVKQPDMSPAFCGRVFTIDATCCGWGEIEVMLTQKFSVELNYPWEIFGVYTPYDTLRALADLGYAPADGCIDPPPVLPIDPLTCYTDVISDTDLGSHICVDGDSYYFYSRTCKPGEPIDYCALDWTACESCDCTCEVPQCKYTWTYSYDCASSSSSWGSSTSCDDPCTASDWECTWDAGTDTWTCTKSVCSGECTTSEDCTTWPTTPEPPVVTCSECKYTWKYVYDCNTETGTLTQDDSSCENPCTASDWNCTWDTLTKTWTCYKSVCSGACVSGTECTTWPPDPAPPPAPTCPGTCKYNWTYTFDCYTGVGQITQGDSTCDDPCSPSSWQCTYDSETDTTTCTMSTCEEECFADGDCDTWPDDPTPPDDPGCPKTCAYKWTVHYNCSTDSWEAVVEADSFCYTEAECNALVLNQWVLTAQDANGCDYEAYTCTVDACASAGECDTWPSPPALPDPTVECSCSVNSTEYEPCPDQSAEYVECPT